MYYYGGGSSCPCSDWGNHWNSGNSNWFYGNSCGCNQFGYSQNYGQNYAIILVLFILLVIVIGARWVR